LTVSSTARALDTALATAKKALDGMPDKELRELVKRTQRDVSLNESLAVPGALGKEVPDSTGEARLDIAHRATAFVAIWFHRPGHPTKTPSIPFMA
jgi:broad specificity phosphatase PhoE